MLAEYAAKLPPGSSASSSMPVLSNLGPKGARQQQQQHHQSSLKGGLKGQQEQLHPEEQQQQKRVRRLCACQFSYRLVFMVTAA